MPDTPFIDLKTAGLATVVTCVLAAAPVISGAATSATYTGPGTCVKCHDESSHAANQPPVRHQKLVENFSKSAHAATLIDTRISPEKAVAQFTTNSPLKLDDIAYAIGAGRGEQRYCDASFKMLPHRWDVRGKKWASEAVVDAAKECFACHTTGYDVRTRTWANPGVTCEACHGPGSLHAQDGGKTNMLDLHSLPFERQAMICGQCHSDGTDPAKVHPFPVSFRPGDDLNKFLTQAAQPRPGPKYSELLRSKHAQMNVICTDCHNPHGPVPGTAHQLLKPVNDLCGECHIEITLAKHAPKAPADATCATCHMTGGSHLFKKPIKK